MTSIALLGCEVEWIVGVCRWVDEGSVSGGQDPDRRAYRCAVWWMEARRKVAVHLGRKNEPRAYGWAGETLPEAIDPKCVDR